MAPFRGRRAERLDLPIAAYLGMAGRGRLVRSAALVMAGMRLTIRQLPGGDRWPDRLTDNQILAYSTIVALPPSAVRDLLRIPSLSLASVVARMARRRVGRAPAPDAYLLTAAERIHGVLSTHGTPAPIYAFGHTHVARIAPIGANAQYVNCGTWGSWLHAAPDTGTDPDTVGAGGLMTFARIRTGGTGESADVDIFRWDVKPELRNA